jgi:hypothetical protein
MGGLGPAIPFEDAQCQPKRSHRDRPGDDSGSYSHFFHLKNTIGSSAASTISTSA